LIGEASFVKGGEEKITGAVAGEDAAGAIPTVGGGGEPENQELRVRITEAGDRFAPVDPIAKGAAFFLGDFFAVDDEARAFAAGDDFLI